MPWTPKTKSQFVHEIAVVLIVIGLVGLQLYMVLAPQILFFNLLLHNTK